MGGIALSAFNTSDGFARAALGIEGVAVGVHQREPEVQDETGRSGCHLHARAADLPRPPVDDEVHDPPSSIVLLRRLISRA